MATYKCGVELFVKSQVRCDCEEVDKVQARCQFFSAIPDSSLGEDRSSELVGDNFYGDPVVSRCGSEEGPTYYYHLSYSCRAVVEVTAETEAEAEALIYQEDKWEIEDNWSVDGDDEVREAGHLGLVVEREEIVAVLDAVSEV